MSKALIVNPYWDTLGGGERYTAAFTRLLLDHHWQADILAPMDYSGKIRDRFGIDLSGVHWLNTNYYSLLTTHYSLLFWLSDGSLPVSFAKKTLIHLQFPFRRIGGGAPLNRLKSRFYTFVVNSRFTKSFIDPEYHVISHVIYPPVDTSGFISGKKQNLILYAGRFSRLTQNKGQQILVDVFKNISGKIPGWQLVLVGGTAVGTDPTDMQQLKKSIAGFPIRVITDLSYPDLQSLMGTAKIFWSAGGFGIDASSDPTRVEHFGITVVEAMSAGAVPVITNLGGHKEIVRDSQDGFLWQTPDELISATLKLVFNRKLLELMSQQAQIRSKIFDNGHFNTAFCSLLKL